MMVKNEEKIKHFDNIMKLFVQNCEINEHDESMNLAHAITEYYEDPKKLLEEVIEDKVKANIYDNEPITLYEIHETILSYIEQGKNIKKVNVAIEINRKSADCLYIDQSEIQDELFILRN
ncbi:MAG: hypothetical protein ACTH0S_05650 [Senegalia sp. (in: firmicutes)]